MMGLFARWVDSRVVPGVNHTTRPRHTVGAGLAEVSSGGSKPTKADLHRARKKTELGRNRAAREGGRDHDV
jgi:hypothetical protein